MESERFECVAPGVGQSASFNLAHKCWGECPIAAKDGTGGRVIGDRIDCDRMIERKSGIRLAHQGAVLRCLPVGAIAGREAAEVVESYLRCGMLFKFGGAFGIEITQHAIADAIAGNGTQLFLDSLEGVPSSWSSGESVRQIDRAGIETKGIQSGEPADRAGEVNRGIVWFTAVALEIQTQRETVAVAACTAPRGCRQDQCSEQDVVDPGLEECGNGCQQCSGGFVR